MAARLPRPSALLVGAAIVYLWARGRSSRARRAAEISCLSSRATASGRSASRPRPATRCSKSQSSLLELAEAKLAPIKETLGRFETQAQALEEQRLRAVTAVGEQLRAVAEGQERLRTETGSLVTALRAPHVRGRWGEVQLKRVVELAGMVDYCDFRTQESERDDEGRLLRPDLVVKLPGGKSIVVDAKVPLERVPRRGQRRRRRAEARRTWRATRRRCATTSASSGRSATGGSSSRRRSSSSCSSTRASTAPRSTRTARCSRPAPSPA